MAVTIVNNLGAGTPVYGASSETGVNVAEFSVTVAPEFRNELMDNTGEIVAVAIGPAKRTVTLRGEMTAAPTATLVAASTFTNSASQFGASSGGLYLTRGSVRAQRNGWEEVDATYESFAGVT